jgi:hypothetical protein
MKEIDVADLPEPIARAIETIVQTVRQQLQQTPDQQAIKDLPRWDGDVIGTLSREDIYDGIV